MHYQYYYNSDKTRNLIKVDNIKIISTAEFCQNLL